MNEKEYWNNRYKLGGNSGDGSYGFKLQRKLNWIYQLDFKTVTDVGCGDFNFGGNLLAHEEDVEYVGIDISDVVIDRNKELYPYVKFQLMDGDLPPADLVLCVDVLLHVLNEEDLESLFQKLEKAWTKYLVITAYERDEKFDNHVRIRKFDPERFGKPILREVSEEDGQMYFYIFERPNHSTV